ncbi:MAG TPA: SPOR domain-containing protein [Casimicrobiaceae bacterium]|nr:SPOR domain-containing protein [Casimicrobiaceae bacterium]
MAEPADINVDELRRRARRRLIGAIVLALGAAVIVPMLLESDPKPLGDDVAVKIPPVDDGKFVNRLNAPQGKSEAPSTKALEARKDTPSQSDTPANKSVADAERAVVAPPTKISKYDTAISSDKITTPAAPPPPTSAPIATAPETSTAKSEAKSPFAAPPDTATASAQAVREGFAVQLAAYSDDKGANALAGRLKRSGYPAYTEPLKTSRGTLWRVRVGPYPSRDAANGVRDKLKGEGQSGIVASAK